MKNDFIQLGPIGVFDSGLGGLEILRSIVKTMPQYDYLYLADTARFPYGSHGGEVIYQFTKQAVDFLFKKDCPLIILACNTASSEALRKIQQEYLPFKYPERKVLGVIIPAVEGAVEKTRNNRIGVMATESAVASCAFIREIKKLKSNIQVFQNACPLLVPIIEAGEENSEIADLALKKYLKPLIIQDIDTLILGCTHYGLLAKRIKSMIGDKINLVVEGEVVAEKLANYLACHQEIERQITKNKSRDFLTTDLTDNFKKLATRFFGEKINPIKINLA